MKTLAILFILAKILFSIQAPFFIDAISGSDSSTSLSWRNNTLNASVIIYRWNFGDSTSSAIDTVAFPYSQYNDISGLLAEHSYIYGLVAFTTTEISTMSNLDTVRTLPTIFIKIFSKPTFIPGNTYYNQGDSIRRQLHLDFYDSSNCEIGFRVWRSENLGPYQILGILTSPIPKNMGPIFWVDSSFEFFKWYDYKVEAFNQNDTLTSDSSRIYPFHNKLYLNNISKKYPTMILDNKISEFPVSGPNWAMKEGHNIILLEHGGPPSTYSVINVSNPSMPQFLGYKSSPLPILSDIYLSYYYVRSTNNKLFAYNWNNGSFTYLRFLNDQLTILKTFGDTSGLLSCDTVIAINDSSIIFANSYYFFIAHLNDTIVNIMGRRTHHIETARVEDNKLFLEDPGSSPPATYQKNLVDYNFGLANPLTCRLGNSNPLPPAMIGRYVFPANCPSHKFIFLDTAATNVFFLNDYVLQIYKYHTDSTIGIEKLERSIRSPIIQAFPNPSRMNVAFRFSTTATESWSLSIYNLLGQRIKCYTKIEGNTSIKYLHWNGTNEYGATVPNGAYLAKLFTSGKQFQVKFVLLH